ncbi:MAG: hypothetical protein H6Q48_5031 [Deltaproteobacteria bacterium]|jgi:hypothetical protein|nr:hypothetical protein [Deltaproteobacteria bacterium]
MNDKNEKSKFSLRAETGELYMLDKKERILMREVLKWILTSTSNRELVVRRFGEEGFKVAVSLLEKLGVKLKKPQNNA